MGVRNASPERTGSADAGRKGPTRGSSDQEVGSEQVEGGPGRARVRQYESPARGADPREGGGHPEGIPTIEFRPILRPTLGLPRPGGRGGIVRSTLAASRSSPVVGRVDRRGGRFDHRCIDRRRGQGFRRAAAACGSRTDLAAARRGLDRLRRTGRCHPRQRHHPHHRREGDPGETTMVTRVDHDSAGLERQGALTGASFIVPSFPPRASSTRSPMFQRPSRR